MGDYIDKGPDSRQVAEFVRELTLKFPTRVHALLGNHELNLLVDRARREGDGRFLEYAYAAAPPTQYPSWMDGPLDDDGRRVLRALHDALLITYRRGWHGTREVLMTPSGAHSIVRLVEPASLRPLVEQTLRTWQAAYLRGVSPRTPLGQWMVRPLTAFMADTFFVHGGLAEHVLQMELPATRESAARPLDTLEAFDELNARWRDASAGVVLSPSKKQRRGPEELVTTEEAEEAWAAEHAEALEERRAVTALLQSGLLEVASELVEYRGLHEHYAPRHTDRHSRRGAAPQRVACDRVAAVVARLNVSRIAVGHTPEDNVRIRCGGRLLALDSTLSRPFRANGNNYCDEIAMAADAGAAGGAIFRSSSSDICRPQAEACEGQIVRLERSHATAPWVLYVVESEEERERTEGAVGSMKVELRL